MRQRVIGRGGAAYDDACLADDGVFFNALHYGLCRKGNTTAGMADGDGCEAEEANSVTSNSKDEMIKVFSATPA